LIAVAGAVVGIVGPARDRHPSEAGNWRAAPVAALAGDEDESQLAIPPIDPALIRYRQERSFETGFREPRGLAAAPDGDVFVVGDRAIRRFAGDGTRRWAIAVGASPQCLAVAAAADRRHAAGADLLIYVGMENHVEVFDGRGTPITVWATLGKQAIVTAIAAADQDVFVADAGNRIVWHYDPSGKLLGRIGERDSARGIPGFFITSRHFALAAGNDGLVYVVNPRALRVEGYTPGGDLETHWGKGSPAIEDFFGCCNPIHLAVLPDGRFVTAEKGAPRIKVYSPQGKFECVVAGPREMAAAAAGLATDHAGKILVLDPAKSLVRVFVANPKTVAKDVR
jgi:DNA-binding beta-propeller fold protein YncE